MKKKKASICHCCKNYGNLTRVNQVKSCIKHAISHMSLWGQFEPLNLHGEDNNDRARGTFVEVGAQTGKEKLERSERSERSVNWRGVRGPAVGPLAGVQGSSEIFDI